MTDWPDELHHRFMRTIIHTSYEARRTGLYDARVDANTAGLMADRLLAALAEWCDGDLWDPTTGQRIVKRHVCDGDWDDHDDEGLEFSLPFACNWTDAAGEMTAGAPLFTLSPRED